MAVDAQEQPGLAQAQKPMQLSRYRSVRRAASQKQLAPKPEETTPTAPVPSIPVEHARPKSAAGGAAATQQGPTIARSMSRYRRQRNPAASNTLPPPVPARFYTPDASGKQGTNAGQSWQVSSKLDTTSEVKSSLREKPRRTSDEEERIRAKHREDAMKSLTGEAPAKPTQKEKPKHTAVADATTTTGTTRRHEGKTASPKDSKPPPHALKDTKPTQPKGKSPLKPADAAANAVAAQVDAPVSAVNAGERKVLVQYRKSSAHVAVTPMTTVQELVHLARASLSDEIDTKFNVIESFTQLDLQRPLRKYEYIRDVMNSWGHDGQNVLIILPPASLEAIYNLEVHSAPEEPPADTTFHLYHAQRSRKWEKRFVTLRADGQVMLAKKYQAKEQTNICHLSDFEIYSPSLGALSNEVKPPKRICYAVKSQQKASMFLTTDNYVHYFCTNEKEIADGWYEAIQTWRSWYLARVLGAGQPKDETGSISAPSRKGSVASSGSNRPRHYPKLLDLDPIEKPFPSSVERSQSVKKTNMLAIDTKKAGATPEPNGSPFSPTGLLGQVYTMRQQAMHEQEEMKKAQDDAFFSQGLVSNAGAGAGAGTRAIPLSQPASRSGTMTGSRAPDLSRSQSLNKQRPLVDLTPTYPEPPQYSRSKGKGVAVERGMPLVNAATGPDVGPNAIVVPPSTDWKRPPIAEESSLQHQPQLQHKQSVVRSNTTRSARYRRPDRACPTPASPSSPVNQGVSSSSSSPDKAFIANGLLARSATSNPSAGHGLATGDRNATKPMLDVSPANPFVEGSLLQKL